MAVETFKNAPTPSSPSTAWTTLNGAIDASTVTVIVASVANLPAAAQFRLLIEDEIVLVTAIPSTTLTVTRGAEGTTAASHVTGTSVYHILTAAALARHPRAMTTTGDTEHMASSGAPTRLAIGSSGQVLTVAAGLPSWAAPVMTPGGSTTQIQYNNAGAFGGFGTWDGSTLAVTGRLEMSASVDPALVNNAIIQSFTISASASAANINGAFLQLSNSGNIGASSNLVGLFFDVAGSGANTFSLIAGLSGSAQYNGASTVSELYGAYVVASNQGGGTANIQSAIWVTTQTVNSTSTTLGGVAYVPTLSGATVGSLYGFWIPQIITSTSTITDAYGVWLPNLVGVATNPYAFWYNGTGTNAGVFRINSLGILAYYNPTFAAYTPGAADFERIRMEWLVDVATFGVEVGGTGTNRALNLVGSIVQANGVAVATASSATAFTNKTGNISQWTNDSSYLTSVTAHNLLSATHGDTTAGTVARGDVITGQGASAKWVRLAKGTANQVLAMDGTATDVVWATPAGGAVATDAIWDAAGDLAVGSGANTAARLAMGSALQVLRVNAGATTLEWAAPAGGGDALVANPLSQFAATTSLQLKNTISDETGSGALVFADTPTFVTPILGTPTSGTLTNVTGLPIASGVSGLGTGVATALAVNVGSAGAMVTTASTDTLTNKRVTKRVTTASDATSITPATDAADVTYQANTQAVGTLTMNADSGTPTHGQSWLLKIKSTNVQTFAWNGLFAGGTTALPTVTTGGSKIDYFAFIYDTVNSKWHYTGSALGF